MFLKKSFLVFVVFCLFAPVCLAKEYTFAIGEYAPFTSKKMPGYGFASEIATAVLTEMGHEAKYKFYPWKRANAVTEKGGVVASFPWSVTEERLKVFMFSDTFCNTATKLFYYKEKMSGVSFKKFSDLKMYKIGGSSSYAYVKRFKEEGVKLDLASSDETGFKKLQAGRLDLFPCSEIVGRQLISKLFPNETANFGVLKNNVDDVDFGIMISKKHPDGNEFQVMFNKGLKRIKKKGIYAEILKKYGIK